ncbi:MORN repeat-containing protein [Caproicibacter sp.]|uniref:MORN repeat-containing protein n=1 Tax=Caproicibacter sp. TaxID=2814884 RepID=UPI003989462A
MKKLLKALWKKIVAYPTSWKDYVTVGRWMIYKKLLIIVSVLIPVLAVALICFFSRQPAGAVPVFRESDAKLKLYSGQAVVLMNQGNQKIYAGQVAAGKYSGSGQLYSPSDGTLIYSGDFSEGKYSGQGSLYNGKQLLYEGGFLNGLYSGSGTLYSGSNVLYSGQFANGAYDGTGTLYEGKNILYSGQFAGGAYNGEGTLYANGVKRYEGGFKNGLYSGQGFLYTQGKLIYTGSFAQGKRDGQGVQTTPDGVKVYEGAFRNDCYDGEGKLYSGGGARLQFEGNFIQGKPGPSGSIYNARGQLLYSGAVYEGSVDYLSLLGIPVSTLQTEVKEVPEIYYGSGFVGYLYPELGFAFLTKYNYSADVPQNPEPPPLSGSESTASNPLSSGAIGGKDTSLFAKPEDNLVVNTLLVEERFFSLQMPENESPSAVKNNITGFEELMESRLARISYSSFRQCYQPRTAVRGDHLFEAPDLPETVEFTGKSFDQNEITYFYRTSDCTKDGVPWVIFCEKDKKNG